MLSPEDRGVYRVAFAAAKANDWQTAESVARGAKEQLPAKILRWLELTRSPTASFADIVAFADGNPDWPLLGTLRQRAEAASGEIPDAELLPYFRKHAPITAPGRLRFADMLAASGQREAAIAVIRALWLAPDLDPDSERAVLDRYGDALRPEDDIARLDRLIWDGQDATARRELPRVPADTGLVAAARLSLAGQFPDAEALLSALPARLRADPGLLFDEARWQRRQDRLDEAAKILLDPPQDLVRPASWWAERQFLTRRLLDEHEDRLAYEVVSRHGLAAGGADYADAEFLAGWITLRRLDEPKSAYVHFERLYGAVKLPVSLARGAYWAGRAAEALGLTDEMRRWYGTAAAQGITYYGQLAAARLQQAVAPAFPPAPVLDATAKAAFENKELARAARMLAEIGEGETARLFLLRLDAMARTPVEHELVASLAETAHRPDVAVMAARRARPDGIPWLTAGYPVVALDGAGSAEPPLVLAITRQESVFDEGAVSRSDARGMMQLKPATAKDVAKSLSLPFSADRLTSDPGYNLTLGRAYLDRMLGNFGGSYVLAIAAYNAGPNRVAQWLGSYGDPHSPAVDIVDWIEMIPFNETRNYVQRVLENLQIYRLRLGDSKDAFTLAQDLRR